MHNANVIVKVGNKSASRFRNARVYRAITIKEMDSLINRLEDPIIIIENIRNNEYTEAKECIEKCNKHVFFFIPDNDENTCGIADELSLDIYLDLKNLYRAIENTCGINLDTDLYLNKDRKETLEDDDDPFNNEFGNFDDLVDINKTNIDEIRETKEKAFRNKIESGLDTITDEELGIETKINEHENNSTEESADTNIYSAEPDRELVGKFEEVQNELADTHRTLDELKAKYDNAINRIGELNKSIKAIKDERDYFRSELENIETSDIIEDPAIMEDYNRTKSELDKLIEDNKNRANITADELNKFEIERNNLQSKIDELTKTNDELESKYNELIILKSAAEHELAEYKDDTTKDDQINSLIENIKELNSDKEGLNSAISELERVIADKENEIDNLNSNINELNDELGHIRKMLNIAADKMTITSSLEAQVNVLITTNDKLENELNQTKAQLVDSQNKLEKTLSETETRVELARNFAREDLENTKRENAGYLAQINILTSQLNAKEMQYNNLIQATGMDENGANTVMENNKVLEAMNNNLRTQIADLKTSYDASERDRIEKDQSIRNLQNINNKLTTQLKAMSSGFSGGISNSMIPPITYNNRAQIISVIGSGSYGITTTAYTMGVILSSNARVLYIDFDLVSAKADTWFKMSPMIKGIPGVNMNQKSSGLGIMIDRGTAFALSYSNMIVQQVMRTKGGCLDYLSGLYDSPDMVKLVACDYANMLNYFGGSYEYIIIDFGRLGSSDINNQLIKLFSDVSRSTVIVTSSDRIDIRNTRMVIQRVRLDISRMAWLINLAENTKIDELSKSKINPIEFVQIPFIDDFYGKKKDFTKDRVSRDKFNMFLNKVVLGR